MHKAQNKVYLLLITIILFLMFGCDRSIDASKFHQSYSTIQPDLSLNFDNKDFIIINYWASWCPPCKKEVKELNELYIAYKDNIAIIGVNVEQISKENIIQAIDNFKIQYPVVNQDIIKQQLDISTEVYPTTYVFNKNGKLVETLKGPVSYQQLEALIS